MNNSTVGENNDKSISIESALVLDCLEMDILIISTDYKILFANAAFLNRLGLSKEAVEGSYCYSVTHHCQTPCEAPNDICPLARITKEVKSAVEVHIHFDKNNQKFLVNVAAALVLLEDTQCFLHVTLPVKEKTKLTTEMSEALKKVQNILKVIEMYQRQVLEIKKEAVKLEETKKDLEVKIIDLEKFNKLTVGRELKMRELKEKIKELETKLEPVAQKSV